MPSVISALFYLWARSLQNSAAARLARLKQPKYMVGAAVGAAYLYYFFLRPLFLTRPSGSPPLPVNAAESFQALAVLLLALFIVLCWIVPRARAALNFSEAEIAFLFPAPLSRRSLVNYRLLGSLMRVLFTAAFMALASSRWHFLPGNFPMRMVGWWMVIATLSLHLTGSSFALTRMLDRGMPPARRQLVVVGIIALVSGAVALWMWQAGTWPVSGLPADMRGLMSALAMLVASEPLRWLLLPMQAVVAPLFAATAAAFFIALVPALLVYAAHYVWVLFSETAFEEASIARADQRAAKIAQMREGRWRFGSAAPKARSAPFDLARARRPEWAFLWKNLLSSADYLRPRTALIAAVIIVVGCTWLASHPDYEFLQYSIAAVAMIAALYLLVFGPMLARQDLRSDLMNADILKIYPLHGWQIVLGEILTPWIIVTVLLWLLLLVAALASQPLRPELLTPQVRAVAAVGLGLLAAPLCALQLLVMNAAAVIFPAWVQSSRNQAQRGIEMLGQRIVFFAGQLLMIAVTLVPAVLVGAALQFALQWIVGSTLAAVVASIGVLAILVVEVGLGVWWLGGRFERFDLSAELRP